MNMKRYFCRYAEEHEECVSEEFQLVYGEASEIRRLYHRLEKNGVTPEFVGEPKYNPDRTYGIVISYDEYDGHPWMDIVNDKVILSIVDGIVDGTIFVENEEEHYAN